MTAVTPDLFTGCDTSAPGCVLLVGASSTATTNRASLSAVGYDIQLERAGGAALVALQQTPFDLIIIDWELPDGDGIELCGNINIAHDSHDA